jgi:hypothetical protein
VVPPALGTLTWDHLLPFQRRTWFRDAPVEERKLPTAQQLVFEVQKVPLSELAVPGETTRGLPGDAAPIAGAPPPAVTPAAVSSAPSSAGAACRRLRIIVTLISS